jgi:predicted DNA-binding transcriptional regulator AlpA
MARPRHWLVVHGQRPTARDGYTIELYYRILELYGFTNEKLCKLLGVPPDRPTKWRNWVYGTPRKQGRPIPPGIYERLTEIKEKLTNEKEPRFIKRPRLAKLLGVSIMSLGRWSQNGRFPRPIKISSNYLYNRDEVLEFLETKKAE